jgi:hypothetical protein
LSHGPRSTLQKEEELIEASSKDLQQTIFRLSAILRTHVHEQGPPHERNRIAQEHLERAEKISREKSKKQSINEQSYLSKWFSGNFFFTWCKSE